MQIAQIHSHLGGQEYLMLRKPELWAELLALVETADVPMVALDLEATDGQPVSCLAGLADRARGRLRASGWAETSRSDAEVSFVKDRVALEVGLSRTGGIGDGLWMKHLALFVDDRVDIGVEMLPAEAFRSSPCATAYSFENEIESITRQGRGIPVVPLVVIGVAP